MRNKGLWVTAARSKSLLILLGTLWLTACGDPGPTKWWESGATACPFGTTLVARAPTQERFLNSAPPRNGEVWCERADGLRHGRWSMTDRDGRVILETRFHKGKVHGSMLHWGWSTARTRGFSSPNSRPTSGRASAVLLGLITYINDVPHGVSCAAMPDGTLSEVGNIRGGASEGVWVRWMPREKRIYHRGQLIQKVCADPHYCRRFWLRFPSRDMFVLAIPAWVRRPLSSEVCASAAALLAGSPSGQPGAPTLPQPTEPRPATREPSAP